MAKELDIIRKNEPRKDTLLYIRVTEEIMNKIKILSRKHKSDRSLVTRSLIEAGLKSINQ